MKPVFQTRFGQDPNGPGNCFSACVASLLECELSDLPDEAAIVAELKVQYADKWETWPNRYKWGKSWERLWLLTQLECGKRGYFLLEVKSQGFPEMPTPVWCIISGKSPRGDYDHSVVGQVPEKIVHDPHPSGEGLVGEEFTYLFFVAVDPAKKVL